MGVVHRIVGMESRVHFKSRGSFAHACLGDMRAQDDGLGGGGEDTALAIVAETEMAGVAGVGAESAGCEKGIVRREATPKRTHD